jgi:hypothetical protein
MLQCTIFLILSKFSISMKLCNATKRYERPRLGGALLKEHVDLAMIERPIHAVFDAAEVLLDKAVESFGGAVGVSEEVKQGLAALSAAGKADRRGARQLHRETLAYAASSLSAEMSASRALAEAASPADALAAQRAGPCRGRMSRRARSGLEDRRRSAASRQ